MRFRFEALLQIHKNKENLLQKQLGDILAHKQTQQNRKDFLKSTRENEIKQVNQRMTQDLKKVHTDPAPSTSAPSSGDAA